MSVFSGNHVADNKPLAPTRWEDLRDRIKGDRPLRDLVTKLRRVYALDRDAYRRLKTQLPYFCTASFSGGIRRADHFEEATAWVMDADHCATTTEAMTQLKKNLATDERILMMFTSPSGDGIKIVFLLETPCPNSKQYSDAYKGFAHEFAKQHNLTEYIDFKTHDCARACFLSSDPDCYFNPLPVTIDWLDYLPKFSPPAIEMPTDDNTANSSHHIQPDVYLQILNNLREKKQKNIGTPKPPHVPEALQFVMEVVPPVLLEHNIEVAQVTDIQYGKKLAVKSGLHTAECNIFYGKRGFSVVAVPRRQSNENLTALLVALVEDALI